MTMIEQLAKLAHEINRAYCEAIGDHTQTSWELAPEWQKESAKSGVRFALDNPYLTPMDQHNAWMKNKIENGWTYGSVKSPEKKTHPCLIDYSDLPQEQKVKDFLFRAAVKTGLRTL